MSETERLWCQACGTVTRDKICDCNRWFDKGHEMYSEPQFVNYADAMQETAHEQAQEIESLRSQLVTAEATYLQFCKKHDEYKASMRSALEFCIDVFDVVQRTYECPDSPIVNMAIEKARAALKEIT